MGCTGLRYWNHLFLTSVTPILLAIMMCTGKTICYIRERAQALVHRHDAWSGAARALNSAISRSLILCLKRHRRWGPVTGSMPTAGPRFRAFPTIICCFPSSPSTEQRLLLLRTTTVWSCYSCPDQPKLLRASWELEWWQNVYQSELSRTFGRMVHVGILWLRISSQISSRRVEGGHLLFHLAEGSTISNRSARYRRVFDGGLLGSRH